MKKLSQIISEVSTNKLVDYVAAASKDVGRRIEKAEPGVKPFKKILNRSGKIGRAQAHIKVKATAHMKEGMCNVCGQTPCNCTSIEESAPKSLNTILEASLHPNALHVSPVKVNGKTKYHVHAVGKNLAHGIKVGEHLTDTHLDDAAEMGAKIKQVKASKAKHEEQQNTMKNAKSDAVDESQDYKSRFINALQSNGFDVNEKISQWTDAITEASVSITGTSTTGVSARKSIATSKSARPTSKDQDTDIIRDFDADVPSDKPAAKADPNRYHHRKMKQFRAWHESIDEAISARQALSKAADFEYKAANANDVQVEKQLKGKAKALRRAAKLAQQVAGTVDLNISKQ